MSEDKEGMWGLLLSQTHRPQFDTTNTKAPEHDKLGFYGEVI